MKKYLLIVLIHIIGVTVLFLYFGASCGSLNRIIDKISESNEICKMRNSQHRCIVYNINGILYDENLIEIENNER